MFRAGSHDTFRRIHRILNECRELGDDAAVWSRHLAEGVTALIDADVIGVGQIGGIRSGAFDNHGAIDIGWERGFNRQGWLNALQRFADNPQYHAGMTAGYAAAAAGESTLLCRKQYVADRVWYRSDAYEATTQLMGFDDELCGFFPFGDDDIQCLIIYRDKKKPRFTHEHRQAVRLLIELLRSQVGGPLATFREIRPTDLPPRVRQALACTLEGDADRQIAERLQISTNTVHQYLKQIYRHFGVSGRNELQARWLKRGWGARCAWRDGSSPTVETIGPSNN